MQKRNKWASLSVRCTWKRKNAIMEKRRKYTHTHNTHVRKRNERDSTLVVIHRWLEKDYQLFFLLFISLAIPKLLLFLSLSHCWSRKLYKIIFSFFVFYKNFDGNECMGPSSSSGFWCGGLYFIDTHSNPVSSRAQQGRCLFLAVI